MTFRPRALYSSSSCLSLRNICSHGLHQVAQNSSKTTCPCRVARVVASPLIHSFTSISGEATTLATLQGRSEEHTSELQSHSDLVCRLLLEQKTAQSMPS